MALGIKRRTTNLGAFFDRSLTINIIPVLSSPPWIILKTPPIVSLLGVVSFKTNLTSRGKKEQEMDTLFRDFKQAQLVGSGPLLATTITPIAPSTEPNRLHKIYNDGSAFSIAIDVRYGLLDHKHTELRFSKTEGNTWVDVYVAYWKALGAILEAENAEPEFDWTRVYEAWKEVANALIRGYSSAGFGAWTVPCLYVAGRYLRVFAIKADESSKEGGSNGHATFQDDIVGENGGHEKLEDAARVLNRMFTLCVSDRYVVVELNRHSLAGIKGLG